MIPTNRIAISQTEYPKGYLVASYDSEGFANAPRWFPTEAKARDYAMALQH